MIEPGRGSAYLALFSEIGFVLLVTTLAGVGIGYWADQHMGTIPVFVLIGLLVGMGIGLEPSGCSSAGSWRRWTITHERTTAQQGNEASAAGAALLCVERALTNDRTAEAAAPMSNKRKILIALVAVVILDVLAAIFVPPFPKGGVQGDAFAFPADGITANLELPAPHVIWDLAPSDPTSGIVQFHPSITSSILTQWIVIAVILTVMILATRGMRQVPGGAQNLVEFAYESLQDFAVSLGGKPAIRYIPIFAAFFLSSSSPTGAASCRPSARSSSCAPPRAT